jgi:hypothetical protein
MIAFILGIWTPLRTTLIPDQEPRAGTGILKVHCEVLRSLGDP